MSFEPLDLLRLAETMDLGAEASARTAVNRAYYAMFLKTRDSLLASGIITGRGAGQAHGEILAALRNNRRSTAAHLLTDLRRRREMADYDTMTAVTNGDATTAIQIAQEVQRLLSRDWGTS